MVSIEDIRSLAQLARLTLSPAEEENLQKDISSILDYVGQISAAPTQEGAGEKPVMRNVLREDVPTPTLGIAEDLRKAFPIREGDFNVVRKIIQKDE